MSERSGNVLSSSAPRQEIFDCHGFLLKHASLPRQQFTKKTLYALYRKARAVHARVYGTESHIAICHRSVGTMRDATQRHGNIRIVAQRMFSLRWYMQNLAVNRFLGSRNSWTCFLGSCVICVGPLKMVSYGVSVWAAGVESVLSGALDVIGLRMGLHTSQGNVLFLFPLLSMGPCWCNDFFLFVFFCQVLWSGDTCLEISHASMSFCTKCRRKSQLIAFQI